MTDLKTVLVDALCEAADEYDRTCGDMSFDPHADRLATAVREALTPKSVWLVLDGHERTDRIFLTKEAAEAYEGSLRRYDSCGVHECEIEGLAR